MFTKVNKLHYFNRVLENTSIVAGLRARTGVGGFVPGAWEESYSQVLGTSTSALPTALVASTGSGKTKRDSNEEPDISNELGRLRGMQTDHRRATCSILKVSLRSERAGSCSRAGVSSVCWPQAASCVGLGSLV